MAIGLVLALGSASARSELVPCDRASDARQIASALAEIARSVDPCGESAEVTRVLKTLERCSRIACQICTSARIPRNEFERPIGRRGEPLTRKINWNPTLRSELERTCAGTPAQPVLRDPTASLLHELVHAAHDCEGINPGEHELEAVWIENIYRRAAGLCQRPGYGDEPMPPRWVRDCVPGHCPCSAPLAAPLAGPPLGEQPSSSPSTSEARSGAGGTVADHPHSE